MEIRAAVAIATMAGLLAGCGGISCDLLGSDSLRRQCDSDGFTVTVYSVPTWIPEQTLRDLWQSDRAAQGRGL